MMHQTLHKLRGFTLVEIMIVVAILGLLIGIGVPGFLIARNRGRTNAALSNLKSINDNIASYAVNESSALDDIIRLWPSGSTNSSPASYIRRQLQCPVTGDAYVYVSSSQLGSCTAHGVAPTATMLSS